MWEATLDHFLNKELLFAEFTHQTLLLTLFFFFQFFYNILRNITTLTFVKRLHEFSIRYHTILILVDKVIQISDIGLFFLLRQLTTLASNVLQQYEQDVRKCVLRDVVVKLVEDALDLFKLG